jgi:hypothetical protein
MRHNYGWEKHTVPSRIIVKNAPKMHPLTMRNITILIREDYKERKKLLSRSTRVSVEKYTTPVLGSIY